eukprot:CAMPEP_0171469200 /NCGR_PEP_ID=MMETSP0945-20130129/11140_1 /TAXON_ID=109269 /ORGANISM="Vaucheria litorea, Strain CCMP2940" /LENGTH=94 /DNA_ID=CAMNT_0011998293 /DNA_START=275 /DNA_END=559 /DNA_ORIENTATION=+
MASSHNLELCHVEPMQDEEGRIEFKIDDCIFRTDDRVRIWSTLTAEEFEGDIVDIEEDFLNIVLIGNIPCTVHIEQIRNLRIQIHLCQEDEYGL